MAWIESHQALGRHPKLRRLARALNISHPTAVGDLHYLWWFAIDFAQDGSLGRLDAHAFIELWKVLLLPGVDLRPSAEVQLKCLLNTI